MVEVRSCQVVVTHEDPRSERRVHLSKPNTRTCAPFRDRLPVDTRDPMVAPNRGTLSIAHMTILLRHGRLFTYATRICYSC